MAISGFGMGSQDSSEASRLTGFETVSGKGGKMIVER